LGTLIKAGTIKKIYSIGVLLPIRRETKTAGFEETIRNPSLRKYKQFQEESTMIYLSKIKDRVLIRILIWFRHIPHVLQCLKPVPVHHKREAALWNRTP
jgi:hypothetical protein